MPGIGAQTPPTPLMRRHWWLLRAPGPATATPLCPTATARLFITTIPMRPARAIPAVITC